MRLTPILLIGLAFVQASIAAKTLVCVCHSSQKTRDGCKQMEADSKKNSRPGVVQYDNSKGKTSAVCRISAHYVTYLRKKQNVGWTTWWLNQCHPKNGLCEWAA
ncbi:hypothetical protein MPER_10608 [Moniliophthora perniciosa FA553]|nr:hypothetical protein MPER_10608 [Moniliophthora perniciosa FA553]